MKTTPTIPAHLNVNRVKARVLPMEPVWYRGKYRSACKVVFLPKIGFLKIMQVGDEPRILRLYYNNQNFSEYQNADVRAYLNGANQSQLFGMEDLLTDILSKTGLGIADIKSCLN